MVTCAGRLSETLVCRQSYSGRTDFLSRSVRLSDKTRFTAESRRRLLEDAVRLSAIRILFDGWRIFVVVQIGECSILVRAQGSTSMFVGSRSEGRARAGGLWYTGALTEQSRQRICQWGSVHLEYPGAGVRRLELDLVEAQEELKGVTNVDRGTKIRVSGVSPLPNFKSYRCRRSADCHQLITSL